MRSVDVRTPVVIVSDATFCQRRHDILAQRLSPCEGEGVSGRETVRERERERERESDILITFDRSDQHLVLRSPVSDKAA